MSENIELFLAKNLLGFDVIRAVDNDIKNGQIIGKLIDLDPLVEYIHYSLNHIPTCVRSDGYKFNVPVGEAVHVFNKDRLYFPEVEGINYVEIRKSRAPSKFPPINSLN